MKKKITIQEIMERSLDYIVNNGGSDQTELEINTHEEYGRTYVEAIPKGKGTSADYPRFFLDHYVK